MHEASLELLRSTDGRALLVEPAGGVWIGRGYEIYASSDHGASWRHVASVPRPAWRRLAEPSRLACRLLRQEIRALLRLADGTLVAACRHGVFFGPDDGGRLSASAIDPGGTPLQFPMRLGCNPGGVVTFGEYVAPRRARPVRIFASRNGGRSFEAVHTFPPGEIVHVHNVVWDPTHRHWWVLSGDHHEEPGIGKLSEDFARFEWLVKGQQQYRAVSLFDLGDRIVYATDTEREGNAIVSLDKATGATRRIQELEGSSLHACRFGGVYAIATSVEPSLVNRSPWATLWISRDAARWRCAWRACKDRWHPNLFQYGTLLLPGGASGIERFWLSGQAVEGLDGRTIVAAERDPSD